MIIEICGDMHKIHINEVQEMPLDDELVAYCPSTKKIVTMNPTFAVIWRTLTKSQTNHCILADIAISDCLPNYSNDYEHFESALAVTHHCVDTLIAAGFICLVN